MFVCLDCGAEFEEPKVEYENQGEYFGAPAWEAFGACPCCGSTDYDEARRCDRCGAPAWEAFGACPCCGSTDYDEARRCDRCGEWTASWHGLPNGILCDICYDDLFG